jgi:hypothetical protein
VNVDAQKLADLIGLGVKRLVEPLVARVKALEQEKTALEARIARLEHAPHDGDGEIVEAEPQA